MRVELLPTSFGKSHIIIIFVRPAGSHPEKRAVYVISDTASLRLFYKCQQVSRQDVSVAFVHSKWVNLTEPAPKESFGRRPTDYVVIQSILTRS
jgi:hypothetical protein